MTSGILKSCGTKPANPFERNRFKKTIHNLSESLKLKTTSKLFMNANKTNPKQFAIRFVESIFVILYIVFEELIWNIFAKPIFQYLKSLIVLDSLRETFLHMNRHLLLGIFILILAIAEALGLLSGMSILNGYLITGIVIYSLKIPIAAFTFWLFDLTRDKLLSFHWLNVSYEFTMSIIDKIIHSSIHVYIKTKVILVKEKLKSVKKRWLGEESFYLSLKNHYRFFKSYFR